ncbi:MAG: amidohydrolase, partial [Erysipelotrichaceae bacterium]|nr:amidohydrolase [Erysipelotrichaceae bacterium]
MKTLYYNGKVYTGNGIVSAFAVSDGRFWEVGSSLADRERYDECINLNGRFVCAGFNDSHMHLLNYGQSLGMARLHEHTSSLEELLRYGKEFLDEHPLREGRWLQGRGFNQDYFSGDKLIPTAEDLDRISKDVPIIFTRACGHCCVVNSSALNIAGITKGSKDPAGGKIGRYENGEPNGQFYDNAIELVRKAVPLPAKEDLKEMIAAACVSLNSFGITSSQSDDYCVFTALPYERINEAYEELIAEEKLTVRVYEQSNFTKLDELKRFIGNGNVTGKGSSLFKIGPLKLLGDGSLGSRTAYLSRPYNDDPGNRGFTLFSDEQMEQMTDYANKNDMQIAVHAIGDGCLDQVLNAIEKALNKHPRKDHRHGIVHCQITRPDQLSRIKELGLHVYAQSVFLDYDNHILESRAGA